MTNKDRIIMLLKMAFITRIPEGCPRTAPALPVRRSGLALAVAGLNVLGLCPRRDR